MRRPALVGLLALATAGIVACSGCGTAPRSPAAPASAGPPTSAGPPAGAAASGGAATPDAVAAATGYYQAIEERRYDLAFAYLDADATGPDGARLTWAAFRQLATTVDSQEGPVTDFTVAASPPLVVVTIGRPAVGRYHAHLQASREGAAWKIIAIDRI